jgi:hypothetical protein
VEILPGPAARAGLSPEARLARIKDEGAKTSGRESVNQITAHKALGTLLQEGALQ